MYHAFALLQPDSALTLATVAKKLKEKFPRLDVKQTGNELVLGNDNWDYHLLLESGPDVLQESEGLSSRIAGLDEDTPLRLCNRRLNLWSDTPDPFMEHFDDHFQVLDALRGFQGVILVDPNGPGLL